MSAKFPRGGGGGANPFSAIRLITVSLSISHWYPGSGVVLDCIDS